MKSKIEGPKDNRVTLNIELETGEWEEAIKQAANKLSQGVKIAGFRPGKAPLPVVINEVGETRVVSEAAESAINKFYVKVLKEQQILPVVPPKISVERAELKNPLIFKAEVVVLPEVELGDYKTIKVEKKSLEVDPSRVEGVLKNIQRQQAKFDSVEREVKQGDWVEIDFEGKIEGKTFEGGSSKNHPLIIGDGVFLSDFENALVGMKASEEKTFSITFPLDYQKTELADKTAEFGVKLHKVKEVKLPELNDDLARAAGDFKTLEALKEDITKFLKEDAEKEEQDREKEEAINQLIKLAKVDLPQELIEQEVNSMWHELEHQLEHRQMTTDDYLDKIGTTEQKLREEWQEPAKKRIMAGLALNEFRKRENIEVTDENVAREIERLKTIYPEEKDSIEQKYSRDWEKSRLKTLLSGQMAIERLWQLATQ